MSSVYFLSLVCRFQYTVEIYTRRTVQTTLVPDSRATLATQQTRHVLLNQFNTCLSIVKVV